jgi:transcriptional regulator with XRE-family HTH domain
MNEYQLDQAHKLLRDVREAAELTQGELGKRLLVTQVLVSRRETPGMNMELRTIAAHCRHCDRALSLRIIDPAGERIHRVGRILGKLPTLTVADIAEEFGVRVLLRVEPL